MKHLYLIMFALSVPVLSSAQSQVQIGSTTVTIDTLNTQLSTPWEMRIEGQTHMWVTERPGRVSRIDLLTGQRTVVLNITGQINATAESGLLGMALHPNFPTTPEVFLVYTYGTADQDGFFNEKLVKYTWNGTQLVNEADLLTGIRAYMFHNGSRLMFLPDNTLLMSTGEQYVNNDAQDPGSLSGKYLRINTDGTIPADNPTQGSYVYTLGHRNSQGIVILPNGKIIISEHGPSTDDEISVLVAGKNYGWPLVHGFCDQGFEDAPCQTGLYTEPIHTWTPTIATSDLVYYENAGFPEWNNRLLLTTLNGQKLVVLQMNSDQTDMTDEDVYFEGEFGRLRDVAIGPNKEIYIATNEGPSNGQAILRLTPSNSLGIEESPENAFVVYPTLVNDYIQVKHELPLADLVILDLNGKEVYSSKNVVSDKQIQINLKSGFYYAALVSNGELIGRQKITKL